MKKLLLSAVLTFSIAALASAQCAVYVCKVTGYLGSSCNRDGKPTSKAGCRANALSVCKELGGVRCTLVAEGTEAGWWASMSGKDQKDDVVAAVIRGATSKQEAERQGKEKYVKDGGLKVEKRPVQSWYVYSNPKE